MPAPPRLLIFDPYTTGHHAEHFRHIMKAWPHLTDSGLLVAATSPRLLEQHPDLLDYAGAERRVTIDSLPAALQIDQPGLSLVASGRRHRRVLQDLVERHRPEHLLLLYLDHAQFALATGLRFDHPLSISGILFRPSFHYRRIGSPPESLSARLRDERKRLVLWAALRNPHMHTVLSLDPTAAPGIEALSRHARALPLPDPVAPGPSGGDASVMREAFGIAPGRKLALLFGALAERKGVLPLLDALRLLSDHTASQLSVLLAGRIHGSLRAHVDAATEALRESPLQLVVSDAFVPDGEIQSLVRASDLILVPYQQHLGSSGVLVRAAAAQRPVLSQDYGLMGYQTRHHRLGQAVDTVRPEAIAAALEAFVADPTRGFDASRAAAFAEANSVEAYTRTLYDSTVGIDEVAAN